MNQPNSPYCATDLVEFSAQLLIKAGLSTPMAEVVAQNLVEADLMGHDTHGLQLLPSYLQELENGTMTTSGEPGVINDSGNSFTWNGNYLPGAWLVNKAIDAALERIQDNPVITAVISNSHHIGCLAAYPERATDKDLIMLLSCSDPRTKTVAPFGGLTAVYGPNPIAMGIPTQSNPIIFDISTSSTANGYVNRALNEGRDLPHPWLLTADGKATSSPEGFNHQPPSTILPLGGLDSGHKGFALGIMVEALTNALGGDGYYKNPTRWSASVFMQIINPSFFGGSEAFKQEMQFFSERCSQSKPAPGISQVRLPGSRAMALKEEQRKLGLRLYPAIMQQIEPWARKLQVSLPSSIKQ